MLKKIGYLSVVLFLALIIVSIFWQAPVEFLEQFITGHSFISVSVFIFLMTISTVFAPITIIPMVPFVALLLGPFYTAIYSVIGWSVGSAIAFWIARNLGKPVLLKMVSEEQFTKYHKYIPEDIGFWWVVFLRMVLPVDILSYVVGLLTNMKMPAYLLATIIGVSPFSFLFAYGYDLVLLKNKIAALFALAFIFFVIIFNYFFFQKYQKK